MIKGIIGAVSIKDRVVGSAFGFKGHVAYKFPASVNDAVPEKVSLVTVADKRVAGQFIFAAFVL